MSPLRNLSAEDMRFLGSGCPIPSKSSSLRGTAPPGEYPPDLAPLFISRIDVEIVKRDEMVSCVGHVVCVGLATSIAL